jgi:hypothetical protein
VEIEPPKDDEDGLQAVEEDDDFIHCGDEENSDDDFLA